MSIFTQIGSWVSKTFKSIKDDADVVAISITEAIQSGLKNGTLTTVAQIVEAILPETGKLPEDVVTELTKAIPSILAFELAVQGLSDTPTPAEIEAFSESILKAFGATTSNSKLWTTLSAQIYGIIQSDVNSGATYTFAQCVIDVEKAYQAYASDVANTGA